MIITYNGLEFFKMQVGDTVVAFNPISKDSKYKSSKFGADICFVSVNHNDFNGTDQVAFGEKQPFVVKGPGEYEVKEIFIRGFESHSSYDGKDLINTIYLLTLDNINVCFLGALDVKELKPDVIEALGEIDILFVPIGGSGVLSPQDAYKLAVQLEPKIIIPMHYEESGKDVLKTFLKEAGEDTKPIDKLTVKKKDLEGKEAEVVVIAKT